MVEIMKYRKHAFYSVLDDDTIHKYFLKQKEIPFTRGFLYYVKISVIKIYARCIRYVKYLKNKFKMVNVLHDIIFDGKKMYYFHLSCLCYWKTFFNSMTYNPTSTCYDAKQNILRWHMKCCMRKKDGCCVSLCLK